jgi:hypothetical protein
MWDELGKSKKFPTQFPHVMRTVGIPPAPPPSPKISLLDPLVARKWRSSAQFRLPLGTAERATPTHSSTSGARSLHGLAVVPFGILLGK